MTAIVRATAKANSQLSSAARTSARRLSLIPGRSIDLTFPNRALVPKPQDAVGRVRSQQTASPASTLFQAKADRLCRFNGLKAISRS